MLDCLYGAVEKIQDSNAHITVNHDEGKIEYPRGQIELYSSTNLRTIHDFFRLLEEQGYLSSEDDKHYMIIGLLPKFNDEHGVYTTEENEFKFDYRAFLHNLINFVNIHSHRIDNVKNPFSMKYVEQKWDDMINVVEQYFNFGNLDLARDCYKMLISDSHEYISKEKLRTATTNIRDAMSVLNSAYIKLLGHILEHEFDASLIESGDISRDPFKRLGIPNQNVSNSSINFEGKCAFIENIVVMHSPPISLLQMMQAKTDSYINIIICVTSPEFYRGVGDFSLVMSMNSFENKLKALHHSVKTLQSTSDTSDAPEDRLGYKTHIVGFSVPLDNNKLSQFIRTVRQFLDQPVK